MGVRDGQKGNAGASSDNGAQNFRQQQQQQQSQQTGADASAEIPKFSFSELSRNNRGFIGKNPASEILTKLTKAMHDLFGDGDSTFAVSLLPLDLNNNRRLPLSVLVVLVQNRQHLDLGTAVHMLMLEASADPFAPIYDNVGGQSIEKLRVASDAYCPDVIDAVFAEVERTVAGTLLDASGCVVPRRFNVEDKGLVHALAANVSKATTTMLNTQMTSFVDLNLAGAEQDTTLGVRTLFNQPEEVDAVGAQRRSDILMELTATSTSAPTQMGVAPPNRQVAISRINGYVEPVWAPVQQQVQQNIYAPQVALNKQIYMARFVMTGLETGELTTIPGQLLALTVAATLRENSAYVPSFLKKGKNGIEAQWHDPGAFNIEANLGNDPSGVGAKIEDTRTDKFNLPELGQLVAATFQQGLMISLDVSECGPDTWYNDVFAAAAEGEPAAVAAILNGADYLTDKHFGTFFPTDGVIAIDECNRIHMGYIGTRDGERDVRNFDYLAGLNLLAEKDPSKMREWSDSFNRTDYSLESRLAVRKKILIAVFGDEIVFTGFARRVTFTDAFISALVQGVAATKIKIRNNTQSADMGSYERVAFAEGGVFGRGGAANLFSAFNAPGTTGGSTTGYRGGFGRWGR